MSDIVEIVKLGHAGDGVTEDGLFVPLTVPGDIVRITLDGARGRLEEVVSPGPSRISAVCRHFGRCGGCSLQMMEMEQYLIWKRELVARALRQRGFSAPPVEPIRSVRAGTRRRASFRCRKLPAGVIAGYYEANSHQLVDVEECPILVPELTAILAPLKQGLARILYPGETAGLHVTASDTGIDLSLRLDRLRNPDLLMEFSRFAAELKVARLCWNGEPVIVNRTPALRAGEMSIALPPDSFLQPSKAGEELLQGLVLSAAKGAKHIADLFCGIGTFAFVLANEAPVLAIDSSAAQIAAVDAAARQSGADVKGQIRNLFRRPLGNAELQQFDAVVLDPPRTGAAAQVRSLAQSAVPSIIYVSCNAASFARDARSLCDGGYRLLSVIPVDQFLWSPHVELFAHFRR
ncbi:MAG TPA: methyltransferase [Blastocatellia bacterium]|nr:methyltransferase [Blastocatellia bacterium]